MARRWKQTPEGSHWGEFGPDDQRGRMNYVDRCKLLQGISEVKEGLTFCLSLPLDYPGGNALNPSRMPPRRYAVVRKGANEGRQSFCYSYADQNPLYTDVVCDDVVLMSLQYSTQWDSLAHVGGRFDADGDGRAEAVFYNGYRAGTDLVPGAENPESVESWARYEDPRAHRLGIENLAEHGVQGRGVLVDLQRHLGRHRQAVGYDVLMGILDADHIEVEKGDMLCLHTGYAQMLLDMRMQPRVDVLAEGCCGLDGRDQRLLQWITDTRIASISADNPAVELPRVCLEPRLRGPFLPLHEHCIFKNGIHLGELWYLTPLAEWLGRKGRSRFLLTAPPLRLPGAVGSPVTPIATV